MTEKAKELEGEKKYAYMSEYEKFITLARSVGAFKLEKWNVFYSSLIVNLALIASTFINSNHKIFQFSDYIMISGIIGLVVTFALEIYSHRTTNKIHKIEYPSKAN